MGLNGFSDYSEGANTWDGKDLVLDSWSNSHRTYKWSESSKPLLTKYISLVGAPRKTSKGIKSFKTININDFTFSSTNKSVQIEACRIVGLTLFTKLLTGRGEGKDKKYPERFR